MPSKLGDADTIEANKEESGQDDPPPPLVEPKMQDYTSLTPLPIKAPPPPPAGSVREVSVLDEGEAVLQWPAAISMTSVAELEEWLNLVVRKLKRRAQLDSEKPGRDE